MSDDPTPRVFSELSEEEQKAFFDLADRFIHLANELAGPEQPPARISAAMMYATARYNAFVAHVRGYTEENEEETVGYFGEEYLKVLREHLSDQLVRRND